MAAAPPSLPGSIGSLADLRLFMEHHVFAVWDFMVLLKELQQHLAPSGSPWLPPEHPRLAGLVNQLVSEEECDCLPAELGGPLHRSHFLLYRAAMEEIGADTTGIDRFLDSVRAAGLRSALDTAALPEPSRCFLRSSQAVMASGTVEEVAAAFAYGRELLVPSLFAALREHLLALGLPCPLLLWYLERHVALDGESHGPLAEQLVLDLCGEDPARLARVERTRAQVTEDRRRFWQALAEAIAATRMPASVGG
ncbi:MAG: DUF3050 domain-containing protein [Synechococcus sp.]